ncbi:unnamed protein product [Parnassius mnemosyne]|uniref:Peptidase C1A papain C-terminal domain-containing protein n=1 Tax=Parnassius mnemosyne TaxID=213953 RepID=A0AAV1LEG8_9NEOP
MWYFIKLLAFVRLSISTFNEEIDYMYKSKPKNEFIKYFNNLNLSWKITHYDNLNASMHFCALLKTEANIPYIKLDVDSEISLPVNFDAREKWPHCPTIAEVYDQGRCGSCWTFGVATTASDRTCIHSNITVRLSEQDFDCCKDSYSETVCGGGNPGLAFNCWTTLGLVSQDCRPYNIQELEDDNTCKKTCKNGQQYQSDKHYGKNVWRVPEDDDSIRTELFRNGPVEAAFEIYEDFGDYKHGIYEHKYGKRAGEHSVRVIGYGEEYGTQYWLVANSWGPEWGENGFFKVKRFQQELNFEDYILTAFPKNS